MQAQIRDLVAEALYPINAYQLPALCERLGLEPGEGAEAYSGKKTYVLRRLKNLSDERVLEIARQVVAEYPNDRLQVGIERVEAGGLITDLTRHRLSEAINSFDLGGKRNVLELLRKHFPDIDRTQSEYDRSPFGSLANDIERHLLRNHDWENSEVLERVGFLTCSQMKVFQFIEDMLHPIRRDADEQAHMVGALNPVLQPDGFILVRAGATSGEPLYSVQRAGPAGAQAADVLISETLAAFDESSVQHAWTKALDRRTNDPEGAITSAKALLETVCKHILDEEGGAYGENDDLPKLYSAAANLLQLAPSQHSETVFKSILGNCQSVVGHLAGLRNRLGDSHGQGKRHVRPLARHAALAVNLAGTMAMFLVSTSQARKQNAQA
jgi:hypothetical protein